MGNVTTKQRGGKKGREKEMGTVTKAKVGKKGAVTRKYR